ncbi:MAG: hypothetical protein VX498_07860 [Myxococcota bacterium]|nr:hypothetical protein [Myxococcota bacterium]
MSRIDQFESQFQAASKQRYQHSQVGLERVLVFTDLKREFSDAWGRRVERFLQESTGLQGREAEWRTVPGPECLTIGDVLAVVERWQPSLVCTYRNLHSGAWRWPYSLSDHLEVLTQTIDVPVLLLPRPSPQGSWDERDGPSSVMALADHLSGDHALVDWAVAMAQSGGTLTLSHVEDEAVFDRYIQVIRCIPEIDSDLAREKIRRQLLREPADYIESCVSELAARGIRLDLRSEVLIGRQIQTYTDLVARNDVELLVLHTKDEGQMAMHGLAYPLTVELRDIPMLLI